MRSNPVAELRARAARSAVIRDLTYRYEEHAIAEQLALDSGDLDARRAHHDAVLLTIRALNAEMDNPKTPGLET